MKLNLDRQFLNLKGEPLPDKMDEVLANALASSNVGKPAKMMAWAISLTNEGEINIDKSDAKFLIEFIENNRSIVNLAKDQLIEAIERLQNVQSVKSETGNITSDDIERDLMRKVNNVF